MATALFFHAHPDDEAIATGGTIAKAAADGHRVIIVTATRGDHGEVAEGVLRPGERLAERRAKEMAAAADALGAARHEFLGYVDSGMMGTPENDAPGSFWQADIDEAATRLARLLDEESVDVLVTYDDHGLYGHPDHIQVHRVGVRAAEMAGTKVVFESTVDRDRMFALMARAKELGFEAPGAVLADDDRSSSDDEAPTAPGDQDEEPGGGFDATFGTPGDQITTRVDVRGFLEHKRRAMQAHASQIAETSFFLAMPPKTFAAVWGVEEYIRRGAPHGTADDDLFAGL